MKMELIAIQAHCNRSVCGVSEAEFPAFQMPQGSMQEQRWDSTKQPTRATSPQSSGPAFLHVEPDAVIHLKKKK